MEFINIRAETGLQLITRLHFSFLLHLFLGNISKFRYLVCAFLNSCVWNIDGDEVY